MAPRKQPVKEPEATKENTNVVSPEVEILMAQNKILQEQVQKQMELMAQLMVNQSTQSNHTDTSEIPFNKEIKVMSLRHGRLNLLSKKNDESTAWKFEKFGQVRGIPYNILREIINANPEFTREGYYYIFNEDVIHNHGLKEYYKNILTKEAMEDIISNETKDAVEMFKATSQSQKEMIVSLLIEKFMDAESVPYDKLDAISRVYGRNIYQLITEIKEAKEIDQPEKG